jgi:hypothetical protein
MMHPYDACVGADFNEIEATMSFEPIPSLSRVRRETFPGVPVREIHGKRLKSPRDLPRQQQKRGKLPDFCKFPAKFPASRESRPVNAQERDRRSTAGTAG